MPPLYCRLLAGCVVLIAACSGKPPAKRDSSHSTPQVTSDPGAAAVPAPDPREVALAEVVLGLFETEHLLRKKIDDAVSRAAFENYVERLDGGKMFLLAANVAELERHADLIDDELRSGSLDLAHAGARTFAARVAVVEAVVAKLLAAPLDHTDEEWIELDAEKLAFAATEADLRERWRQRLELEVLGRVAQMEARLAPKPATAADDDADHDDEEDDPTVPVAQIPTTADGRDAKARADLGKTYAARFVRLRDPGPLDAASDLVNAVSTTLDPHSDYLPPADKANFDIQMSGAVEGIGAQLREHDNLIEITDLVPGGAAWRQGELAKGDLILSVAADGKDPVDVFDMKIEDVVKMIRGPKGTVVHIKVRRPSGEERTVSVTRDVVVIEAAYARGAVLSPKGKASYGYINLPSFYGGDRDAQRTAAGDVTRLLRELKQHKVSGVILDLRSNGGGILGDAVEITGDFIDTGPVVQVQNSSGKRQILRDEAPGTETDDPVVVLVDRFSASASEIVAAALQDYQRAIVVGTGPTHGKGTVQSLAGLDRAGELGVMKLTIQQFFRISGSSTQRKGVVPDILLPDPAGYIESGERTLPHAIEWSQVDRAEHEPWRPTWTATDLAQSSALRVGKDPVFAKITAMTELLRKRQADTRVPLAKPAWEARRKDQRAALDAVSPDLAKLAPRLTVKSIDDPTATVAPSPNGKTDDRLDKWRTAVARDPWVEECVYILRDMVK